MSQSNYNNKIIIADECYMNLPAISYYINHYEKKLNTDMIDVVAYIYDINRNVYTIQPVSISKDMLEHSPNAQMIMVDGTQMEVWKMPCQRNCTCKCSDTSKLDSHINATKLLSLHIATFTDAPFNKVKKRTAPSSPTAALGALHLSLSPSPSPSPSPTSYSSPSYTHISPYNRSRLITKFGTKFGGKHRYTKKAKKTKKTKKTKRH